MRRKGWKTPQNGRKAIIPQNDGILQVIEITEMVFAQTASSAEIG
jgi:hypothetical protein